MLDVTLWSKEDYFYNQNVNRFFFNVKWGVKMLPVSINITLMTLFGYIFVY